MPTIAKRKIKRFGWQPDLPDLRDYKYTVSKPTPLPDKVSLRVKMGPVLDQGELGSCTAHALSGAMTFIHKGFQGSRLQLYYDERQAEGTVKQDSGAQLRDGVKVLNKLGMAPEKDWPYDIAKFADAPSAHAMADAAQHKVATFQRLPGRQEFRHCLAAGFPFVIGITVYESFESEEAAAHGIIPMPKAGEQIVGGHAVCVIGYDSHKKVGKNGSGDYYEVRNSWGPDWGDGGNFWIPAAYLDNGDLADDAWTIRT